MLVWNPTETRTHSLELMSYQCPVTVPLLNCLERKAFSSRILKRTQRFETISNREKLELSAEVLVADGVAAVS
ncbi:hypothetical protein R1flu_010893 [Riccia fluitans]|uniref:Uncharacterized protein n=1 Tax=Riccia fluitans TaxID=41844 RepID=A0ABD1Z6M0_9MARC